MLNVVPVRVQAVERKRLQELDRWREQQAATGEEEENANFAPVQVRDGWGSCGCAAAICVVKKTMSKIKKFDK